MNSVSIDLSVVLVSLETMCFTSVEWDLGSLPGLKLPHQRPVGILQIDPYGEDGSGMVAPCSPRLSAPRSISGVQVQSRPRSQPEFHKHFT